MAIQVQVVRGCTAGSGTGWVRVITTSDTSETIFLTLNLVGGGFAGANSGNNEFGGSTWSYTHTFSDLLDDDYTITVSGSSSGSNVTYQLQEFKVFCGTCDLDAVAEVTQDDINGAGTGQVTVNATSSHGPIEYAFANTVNWVSNNVFNGIAAGSYPVYIRDAAGCQVTRNIVIPLGNCTIALVTLTVTNETGINGNNGTVTSSVSGANGTVTYSIDGTNYRNDPTFLNLSAGSYTYYAKDAVGCITSQAFVISEQNVNLEDVPEEYLQDERFTISYQPELKSWTSLHSYVPNHYVSRGNRVFMTINDSNTMWELNKGSKGSYFGNDPENPYKFRITFIVNVAASETKIFDNMVIFSNTKDGADHEIYKDTFNRIRVMTNYQNSDYVTLVVNEEVPLNERLTKTKLALVSNEFRLSIPRSILHNADLDLEDSDNLVTSSTFDGNPSVRKFLPQMKDKYLKVDLIYDNLEGYELDLVAIKTVFRLSPR